MGKFGKWVAGGLGWAFFGPVGGILGFALGSIIESSDKNSEFTRNKTTTGSFAMTLLVLIAAVMKADGKILQSELNYVKNYFQKAFGADSAKEAIVLLRDILKQDIPVDEVCYQIKNNLDYSSRLQLLHLLFGLSLADNHIDIKEIHIIERISTLIGISQNDYISIKAMFYKDVNSAYKILEIDPNDNDENVKKAYRKMAIKYHPDKVSYLGEDFQKTAKEKFQKVNEAYEQIKKERNIA